MDLEHADKGIERHKAALAQAKKKYTEALKEKWDGDTELTAIRGKEFDPALAICPTCGQMLPEEYHHVPEFSGRTGGNCEAQV